MLREVLMNKFGAREVDLVGDLTNFSATVGYMRLKRLDLIFGDNSTAMRLRIPAAPVVKQQIASRGSGRTSFGCTQFDVDPQVTGVIPAGVDMEHHNGAGLAQFIIRIDSAALQTKLSAMTGCAIVKDITFDTSKSFATLKLQRVRRLLQFIVDEIDRWDCAVPTAALDEFEQMLLVFFLVGNAHNFSDLLERGPRAPAPWQVGLVEEYIDANWDKPITMEALTAVTGGSARSIFKGFKEARGATPMTFLKSVRLKNARLMLETPDEGSSVAGIAFACGFLNAGHFARDYHRAFGELPSATLAKARHRRG
jgi:AraC-like DNA-binding protein